MSRDALGKKAMRMTAGQEGGDQVIITKIYKELVKIRWELHEIREMLSSQPDDTDRIVEKVMEKFVDELNNELEATAQEFRY